MPVLENTTSDQTSQTGDSNAQERDVRALEDFIRSFVTKLNEQYQKPNDSSQPAAAPHAFLSDYFGDDPATVSSLQKMLKKEGLYKGDVDEIAGIQTTKALQKYLHNHGFYNGPFDGNVSPEMKESIQNWLKLESPGYQPSDLNDKASHDALKDALKNNGFPVEPRTGNTHPHPDTPHKPDHSQLKPYPPGSKDEDIALIRNAIGKLESHDRNHPDGNYECVGAAVHRKDGHIDHAYGKYQIMGDYIPEWSKKALGYSITKEQFMHGDERHSAEWYQDTIAQNQMAKYYRENPTVENVASRWFTGQPYNSETAGRHDVTGVSNQTYVKVARNNYDHYQQTGGPPDSSGAVVASSGHHRPPAAGSQPGLDS